MQNWLIGASGGGKSYEAVRYHILPALEQGRHVITNLPLVLSEFEKLNPEYLKLIHLRKKAQPILGVFTLEDETPKFDLFPDGQIIEAPKKRAFSSVWDFYFDDSYRNEKGQGPLFVVDEVHLSLPRRDCDKQVEEWQSCHRHFNCDLLFITQSYGKCSAAICDNTQIVYRVRKNIAFGSADSYVRKVQDGFRGDVVNTAIRTYDSKYFPLYKSHTQGQSVEEFGANDIVPFWRRWPFIGLAICILIFLLILPKACSNNPFDAKKYQKKPIPANTKRPLTKSINSPVPPGEVVEPQKAESIKIDAPSPEKVDIQKPLPVQPKTDNFLSGHGLHIVGINRIENKTVYFLLVSQNATGQFITTSPDLKKAGYEFNGFTPCLASIKKDEFSMIVSCDSPSLLNIANNSPRT